MYTGIIYGGTGAIGREFIDSLSQSNKWKKIFIVTRRMIDRFEKLKNNSRFQFIIQDDIMNKDLLQEELKKQNLQVDGVYNFLGSRVGHGKDIFVKIDKEYVIDSCQFALDLKAHHFMHVSSNGADENSLFFYMKTKGQTIQELKKITLPTLTILKPGLLVDRDNDSDTRIGEKIAKFIPFIPKIKAKDLGKYCQLYAEKILDEKISQGIDIKENKKIIEELKNLKN